MIQAISTAVLFNNMKQYRFCLLITLSFFLFLNHSSFSQNCESGSLSLGMVDSQWVYKNKDLKISFILPRGWYLFDQVATEKKYLRIGSDYGKISEPMADREGPTVDMAQVKQLPFEYALTLLSIAKLQDTLPVIPSANEIQQNCTISFRAYYADTSTVDQFLKMFYRKITRQKGADPEIKEGKLGELDYKYILIKMANKSGEIENRVFGVRNFGCINVMVRITYITDADFSLISDICSELKIEK